FCTGNVCTSFNPSAPYLDSYLLLSCSKDESVRFWDTRTGTCLCVFAGDRGHREHVLSIDIHPCGDTFVSGGLDTSVKIWALGDDPKIEALVGEAGRQDGCGFAGKDGGARTFVTPHEQFPVFSTNKVHTDYVDCVRYCGGAILSKSVTNVILMWEPVMTAAGVKDGLITPLREFVLSSCEVWFIRFNLDDQARWMAAGNRAGNVKVWSLWGEEEGLEGGGKKGKGE
ncbi:hypothetical protein TeGR_g10858, partial [Tetraparma gracilis]